MKTSRLSVILLLAFIFKFSFQSIPSVQRCKTPAYSSCTPDHISMSIWCDDTNLTSLPHPERIKNRQAKINLFKTLCANRSCISNLNENILKLYHHLELLDVSTNFIREIQVNTFRSSKNLITLILSNNLISKIPSGGFNGLINLRELDLGGNRIKILPDDAFSSLSKLETLKLNNNALATLPKTLFENLKNLQELDLSENHLHNFPAEYLKGLTKLRILKLQSNQLSTFDGDIFLSAPNINILNLMKNRIKCLEHEAFAHGSKIKAIFLAENPLETPKKEWFFNMVNNHVLPDHQKQILSAIGNWKCDCTTFNFRNFVNINKTWKPVLNINCSYPPELNGRMLSELSWKDLTKNNNCNDPDVKKTCHEEQTILPSTVRPAPRIFNVERRNVASSSKTLPTAPVKTTTAKTTTTATTTTTSMPVSSKKPTRTMKLEVDFIVVVIITSGVGVILLLIGSVCIAVKCTKKQQKRKRHVSESSSRKKLSLNDGVSDRSSRDDLELSNNRPLSVPENNSHPELYARDCGTGRSESPEREEWFVQQSQTQPKIIYNAPIPHLNSVPVNPVIVNSPVSGYFNNNQFPSQHVYETTGHPQSVPLLVSHPASNMYIPNPSNGYPSQNNFHHENSSSSYASSSIPYSSHHQQQFQMDPSNFTQPKVI